MSAIDEFTGLLDATDTMKQVIKNLREEPAYLLGNICREYEKTGQPVPDHRLQFTGLLGETTPQVLISAGLVKRESGDRLSIHTYEPTPAGLEQYRKLQADGFFKGRQD